jgi:glycosyltransferase involved in cell wall biosynthesis
MAIDETPYSLAVVYIVKNEAKNLAVSLPAISSLANEIIILDSGSTDSTEKVCAEFNVRFFINEDWQGFGIQRQRAQAFVNSDWILMLDADEELTDELKNSILEIKKEKPGNVVYSLRRLDCIFGKTIDSPYWINPVKAHKRLYPTKNFKFSDSPVHESLQTADAVISPLKGYLRHHTADTPEFWLDKRLSYAHSWAMDRSAKGKKSSCITIFLHTFFSFFKQYFLDGRFLSGKTGLIYSFLFMSYTFNKYAMLHDLNHQRNSFIEDNDK